MPRFALKIFKKLHKSGQILIKNWIVLTRVPFIFQEICFFKTIEINGINYNVQYNN